MSANFDDAQPGPSTSISANDEVSQCETSSVTSDHDASDGEDSSVVSSDDFSSGGSSSDSSDHHHDAPESSSKEKYVSQKPIITAQLRKTCESLKGLLARRKRREEEEKKLEEEKEKEKEGEITEKDEAVKGEEKVEEMKT